MVRWASADDVVETVAFVRARGVELAARSGGHCFAGRSTTRGVLIDVSPMRAVSVSQRLARIEAGATLGEVYLGLIEHRGDDPGRHVSLGRDRRAHARGRSRDPRP